MQTQKGIARTFVIITLSFLFLFIFPNSVGQASEPAFTVFLPVVQQVPAPSAAPAITALSLEVTNDKATYLADELALYNLDFIRGNLGNANDPYRTPYQMFLSGGWAAVDEHMLPDIEGWREAGAEPLFIFMPGGACTPPTTAVLDDFADFIVAAVERYDLNYFEVWNEPDATGGLPSLYGCLGTGAVDKLIYLLGRIRPQLDGGRQMGVSFMMEAPEHFEMMKLVAPHVDFVGIHHYGLWSGGQVVESAWPGSLELKYEMVVDAAGGKPVWITEFNLRSPGDECGLGHQEAAVDYVNAALELGAPMISILAFKDYPDWQCTGIRDTPVSVMLIAMRSQNP